jgi:hypothetical protein
MSKGKIESVHAEKSATAAQTALLRGLGLRAPRTQQGAYRLISFLERARSGGADPRYFRERVANVKAKQDELLGKRITNGDHHHEVGTIIDLLYGKSGISTVFVEWPSFSSHVALDNFTIVD